MAVSGSGCSHQQFVQTTTTSLQATVQLTDAIRVQAVEASKREHDEALADLEARAAKLPPDAPDRAARVAEMKAATAAQLAETSARRDRVLRATAESYRLLGMAALLLPLLDDMPEKKVEVVRLVGEAYAALERAK